MTDVEASLIEFHRTFGSAINDSPTIPLWETRALRRRLLVEEFTELIEALDDQDLVSIVNEAVDLVYVTVGLCVAYGLPFNEVFDAVHFANMLKLGSNGKPIIDAGGKMLKPKGWQPANIAEILKTKIKEQ